MWKFNKSKIWNFGEFSTNISTKITLAQSFDFGKNGLFRYISTSQKSEASKSRKNEGSKIQDF